jgi:hypothetical protein
VIGSATRSPSELGLAGDIVLGVIFAFVYVLMPWRIGVGIGREFRGHRRGVRRSG